MTDAEWEPAHTCCCRALTCSRVENLSRELFTDQTPKTSSPYSRLHVIRGCKINSRAEGTRPRAGQPCCRRRSGAWAREEGQWRAVTLRNEGSKRLGPAWQMCKRNGEHIDQLNMQIPQQVKTEINKLTETSNCTLMIP